MASYAQTLYVLVYPSRLFAAHWSFWIPYLDADGRELKTGNRIHVTGDRLNGFQYEAIREYNASDDERHPNAYPIGLIPATFLEATKLDPGDSVNAGTGPINAFDSACREIKAPGPSLNKVVAGSSSTAGPAPRKLEVRDCQWWVKQAVARLVESGILLPLRPEAGSVSDTDPCKTAEHLPIH